MILQTMHEMQRLNKLRQLTTPFAKLSLSTVRNLYFSKRKLVFKALQ